MNNKTLYVTDLDGTLLNSHAQISQKSLEIMNQFILSGMHFTYATARSLSSSSIVTQGLQMNIPVIVYNGAFIINAQTKDILYSCSFSDEERLYVKSVFHKYHLHPLVYSFVDEKEKVLWHYEFENEGMQRYLSQRKNDLRMTPLEKDENLYQGKIFYYTCIGQKENLLDAYNHFKNDERLTCTFQQELYCDEYWLEIMPKKATKANAVEELKKIWNCDRVVCFGDAINDIPMFEIADESYAVSNAVEALKQLATAVILDNNHDAVATWLMENYE